MDTGPKYAIVIPVPSKHRLSSYGLLYRAAYPAAMQLCYKIKARLDLAVVYNTNYNRTRPYS